MNQPEALRHFLIKKNIMGFADYHLSEISIVVIKNYRMV